MHKILGAKSQEPRAKSQEPRAKSQEPRAKSQEPSYTSDLSLPARTVLLDRLSDAFSTRLRHPRTASRTPDAQTACDRQAQPARDGGDIRHRAHGGRFGAAALVVALALAFAPEAAAQTASTLVTNLALSATSGATVSGTAVVATAFTTGSHGNGYFIQRVTLKLSRRFSTDSPSPVPAITIRANNSGTPGATLVTLVNPTINLGLSRGNVTFTAPAGTTLAASTTYFLAVRTTTSDFSVFRNDDNGETSAFGWTIADGTRYASTGSNWADRDYSLLMRIEGSESTTPAANNNAPTFTAGDVATRTLDENVGAAPTATAANLGDAFTATDADSGDTLTYSLEGTDAGAFTVNSNTGQLRTRVGELYDFESGSSYAVTVKVDDGNGGSDRIIVFVLVTDAGEPPLAPAAPTVSSGSTTSLTVVWSAPSNTGRPAISSYDLQYRQGMSGPWTAGPQNRIGTSATISSLAVGTAYQVQVRASNVEGRGPWSSPGSGSTNVVDNEADVLVSNFAERPTFPGLLSSSVMAQAFTTGTNANGYTLTSIELRVNDLNLSNAPLVELRRSNANNQPGDLVTMLTNPDIVTSGSGLGADNTFTAPPGTTLVANTTYFIVAGYGSDELRFTLSLVDTNGETGAPGWSIGDDRFYKGTYSTFLSWSTSNRSMYLRINGPDAPDPPTGLSATHDGSTAIDLSWSAPADTGGSPITGYKIEVSSDGSSFADLVANTASAATTYEHSGLPAATTRHYRVSAINAIGTSSPSDTAMATTAAPPRPPPPPPPPGPRTSVPGPPTNLTAVVGDGQIVLSWDAPASDGGAAITDYEYRINGSGPWIPIGSTDTTHTVTGLVNGTEYTFQVRAVNRIGKSRAPNQAEATPEAPEVFTLDFAHFANGDGTTSDLVFVNVAPQPVRPALYFYDTEGALVSAESVVDVTGDLEVQEDGGLTVLTEMEPLGELTIATHGQGELVSGSVTVVSNAPLGGMLRFDLPGIGEAVVEASPPVSDTIFPVRRREGGITTGVAVHNLEEEAMEVSCELLRAGAVLEEVAIPLAANGQTSWLIDAAFPAADTSDFAGAVRCDAPGRRRFSAVALEMDPGTRVFLTLPLFPVDRGGGGPEAALDFAHFANGDGTTSDLVFVNLSTQRSRPAPTPFHTDIPPIRPAIYFYDTEGNPIAAESVVDLTGDLAIQEDGGLTVLTEMEPLGVLTVSTHGQGPLVSGSVRVVSRSVPSAGCSAINLPHIGEAVVGASPPVSDAIFPVRRREGGITTGVAIHNLESSPGLVRCDLLREGVLRDSASIPLEANGQTSWLIDQAFPNADTSDFTASVRCDAVGEGRFSAVALEMDPATRTFITLPVFPVPEMPSQE